MTIAVVKHRVHDYNSWRKVYEEAAPLQRENGVTSEHVYRSKDDPNELLVLHNFASMPEAESFFANPELKGAMERSGIEGTPRIELYEDAKA